MNTDQGFEQHPDVERRIEEILAHLRDQWIMTLHATGEPGEAAADVVTSRGWVLRGNLARSTPSPQSADSHLTRGAHIAAASIAPSGTMTWLVTDENGANGRPFSVSFPWALTGPRGVAVVADATGRIGTREDQGPLFASRSAMAAWRTSDPSEAESQLLLMADDDWLMATDVADSVRAAGVTNGREIALRGIDLLARMIARGELVAGTIGNPGFAPDPGGPADWIEGLATTWSTLAPQVPEPGQVGWYAITDAGADIVEELFPEMSSRR
jgi:hypothetical protein